MTMGGVAVARDRFSWGKGLLHAAIPVLVIVVVGVVAAAIGWFPSARAAGEAAGGASLFLFLGGLVASWLLQTGRRGCGLAGFLAVALASLAVIVGIFAVSMVLRHHPDTLTEEDKRFPEIYFDSDGQRFRHPTLGFSLPAPTERFAEAPAVAEQVRNGLSSLGAWGWAWAWEDPTTQERILISLAKGQGGDRDDFEDYCGGMKNGLAGQDGVTVVRDETRWNDGSGDYLLQMLIQERVHFDTRCISGRAGEGTAYVACVMTVAGEPTWSRRFLAGLEAAPPS